MYVGGWGLGTNSSGHHCMHVLPTILGAVLCADLVNFEL